MKHHYIVRLNFEFLNEIIPGLKTVISELAPTSTALAASICQKITGRLTNAISKVSQGNCPLSGSCLQVLLSQMENIVIY